jgi:MFS family permease
MVSISAGMSEDDARAENKVAMRNALLYSACGAVGGAAAPVSIALGGLAGSYLLGVDKSLATAPVTGFNVGMALMALPAAMLMRALGRKGGFISGAAIGICGMLLAAFALLRHDFWLFAFALLLCGAAGAFTQQYRFAAMDRGTADFKARAVGWTLTGGVLAAIIGPQLILHTRDLLAPVPFAGAYLSGSLLFVVSILFLTTLAPSAAPGEQAQTAAAPARPLAEIAAQPRFLVALLCGTGAFALMSFVMTAAPLAMVGCGFSVDEATLGIQWHVLAMFAPSYFTGALISRFGKEPVVAAGLAILLACAAVALNGITLAHFWGALVLLGIGWNFAFIGATAMLTDCYRPSERAKAQGLNDFVLFSSVAIASLMSGRLLSASGWELINMLVLPIAGLCLLALGWMVWAGRRGVKVG